MMALESGLNRGGFLCRAGDDRHAKSLVGNQVGELDGLVSQPDVSSAFSRDVISGAAQVDPDRLQFW
jgi:hypothetical protein